MQTVTPGASHLEITPIADGTWQFGGDWESVDEQAALAGLVRERLTRHVGGLPLQHGPDHRVRQGDLAKSTASWPRGTARRPLSGRCDMTTIQPLRAARQSGEQQCPHRPPCPRALAHDRSGARIRASHPEQGWSLLCNGVVIFDDGGALLPDGRAILPPPARARMVAAAA